MNFNSIITKLIIIFFIVIVLFINAILAYIYYENERFNTSIKEDYSKIAQHLHENRLRPDKLKKYIISLNFEMEHNPREIMNVKNKVLAGRGFELVIKGSQKYLHVHTPDFRILFKDLNTYKKNYYGLVILGILFLFFIVTFLWIIKTITPLKNLKEKIEDFANGNLQIDCKSDKKDEIAQVANEFDKAVKKIALLLESRQLFLRTVMHELKTPIAKGKIVTALIDDEVQKNRIGFIFNKLNVLIDDFAKTEQVISKNYTAQKQPFSMGAILDNAVDMMMLDKAEDKIKVENITNKKLNVDLGLFSLAIKNLIDNGIKYSLDKKVLIKEEENELHVSSKGEQLPQSLEEYFKPFHNDTNQKNHGMGLGLYIIKSILDMHNMKLEYKYNDGNNCFIIRYF